jgi:ferritin
MLSQAMSDHLNQQINLEMYSSHLYLQMSSWCAYKALDGCATFLIPFRFSVATDPGLQTPDP